MARNWRSIKPIWKVGAVLGGLILAVVLAFLFGLFVMWLWNWLMPAIFGLGTIPGMFLVGIGANLVTVKFRQNLFRLATVLVILLGIYTVYKGGRAIVNPAFHQHQMVEAQQPITSLPESRAMLRNSVAPAETLTTEG